MQDTPAPQLARETLDAIERSDGLLAAAIRQRDGRDGRQDFQRFVTDPVTKIQFRWSARPREQNSDWIPCILAVQEELNRYADSWKAGEVARRNKLLSDSLRGCAQLATPKIRPS